MHVQAKERHPCNNRDDGRFCAVLGTSDAGADGEPVAQSKSISYHESNARADERSFRSTDVVAFVIPEPGSKRVAEQVAHPSAFEQPDPVAHEHSNSSADEHSISGADGLTKRIAH